jgi:putative component of membrane protein insertase Oxa1/YidC/SpoIIIJ protein YidD
MRIILPEIFEGQPRIITVAVLLYFVVMGPYVGNQMFVSRPKFPFQEAAITLTSFLFCAFFSIVLPKIVNETLLQPTIISLFTFLFGALLAATFFRRAYVTFIIVLYQRRAPSSVRSRCYQDPSCSEYMRLAVIKYGWIAGVKLGWARLTSCAGQVTSDSP